MKKIMHYAISVALSGLLVSQISFAGYTRMQNIIGECNKTANQLRELIQLNPRDYCAGDLESLANKLEDLGARLNIQRPEQIIASIKYIALELKEITRNRTYCNTVAASVNPVINNVTQITNDVELMEQGSMTNLT